MAKVNTLFKKGYLLAVVIMAANMFIGNEMKAMEKEPNYEEDKDINEKKKEEKSGVQIFLDNFYKDDIIMFTVGGLVSSVANNYFKWWNYNAGTYRGEFGCIGWRSKRLLNDILQFEGNFNLGRGISWSIFEFLICYALPKWKKNHEAFFPLSIAIRGFLSAPLTLHFSKFSISISLDAILRGVINILIYLKHKKEEEEEEELRKEIIELNEEQG